MLRERVLTQSAILNVMIEAALKAGRGLVRDFGEIEKLQVSRKGTNDFVSNADQRAERTIKAVLEKARPGYSHLMEESGTHVGEEPDHRWIVDPLDGTTNFLHGLPGFCVSIAYEHKGAIRAGVIYDPLLDELFWAEKDKGAFLNSQRLRVSGRRDIKEGLFITGVHGGADVKQRFLQCVDKIIDQQGMIRCLGSAALSMAYVAAGRSEGYFEENLKLWDVAAGKIIIEESKGIASYNCPDDMQVPYIIASSVEVHEKLKGLL